MTEQKRDFEDTLSAADVVKEYVGLPNVKDMVKDNKQVFFSYYKDGQLFYVTECGFEFPVPISDIGNATFLKQDKAMLFMRYIRKQLKVLEEQIN